MCDYCENKQSIISFKDDYEDDYTGMPRYKAGDIYITGNELNLSCDVEVTGIYENNNINCCPMCGRRLDKWLHGFTE